MDSPDHSKVDTLADRVKRLLRQNGKKQAELAEVIGMSPAHVSRLLAGNRRFTAYLVEEVAKFFNLPVADLVVGTDEEDLVRAMGALVPRDEYEALLKKLGDAVARTQELEANVAAAMAGNAQLGQQVADATTQADAATAARQRADADRVEAITQRDHLARELKSARDEAAAASAERDSLATSAAEARAGADVVRRELAACRSNARQRDIQVAALEAEVRTLRQHLAAANQLVAINYDAWKQASAEAGQLRNQLNQANAASAMATAAAVSVGLIGLGATAAALMARDEE